MQQSCPCGSGQSYQQCCKKFIEDHQLPGTAEQLMRSRYTAYVLNHETYLLESWHSSTRPSSLNLADSRPGKWIGLKIRCSKKGQPDDDEGWVEFEARYKVNGKAEKLRENSRFVKEQQQWFYVDGEPD